MGKRKEVARVKREPTNAELQAAEVAKANVKGAPLRPTPVVDIAEGVAKITAEHADEDASTYMVMDTLGTSSNGFTSRALFDLLNTAMAIGGKPATTQDLQAAFAFIGAVGPQNEMEAALAVQMYATHSLALDMVGRARLAGNRLAMNDYGNLATKMQRTFTTQLDALTKLRTGGKQVVEHRHIYVDNRGGQAVFADNLTPGGDRNGRNLETQPYAPSPALLGADAAGYAMPGSSGERLETVPNARRTRRRSEG